MSDAYDKCSAYRDDGVPCRRKVNRLNGLCGTCHGITVKYKQCTKHIAKDRPFDTHCGDSHRTLEEIEAHKAARSKSRTASSRRGNRTTASRPRSSVSAQRTNHAQAAPLSYHAPNVPPHQTSQSSDNSYRKPQTNGRRSRRPIHTHVRLRRKRELTQVAKLEAAKVCVDVIISNNIIAEFESQITSLVGRELMGELAAGWNSRYCDDIAEL